MNVWGSNWIHNKKGENDVKNPIQTATGLLWDLERVTLISQRQQGCHRFSWGVGTLRRIKWKKKDLWSRLGNLHMLELAPLSTFKAVWRCEDHPWPVYYASTHRCWAYHPQLLHHATVALPLPSSSVAPGFWLPLKNIKGIFSISSSHFENTDYLWVLQVFDLGHLGTQLLVQAVVPIIRPYHSWWKKRATDFSLRPQELLPNEILSKASSCLETSIWLGIWRPRSPTDSVGCN